MGNENEWSIQNIYSKPEAIDGFVNQYNKENPAHKMPDEDRATLKGDPKLAEAVFGPDGLIGLIGARATTVSELKGKSPDLLQALRSEVAQGVIKDNVLTIDELSKYPDDKLKKVGESLKSGDPLAAALALEFNNLDQLEALVGSIKKTQERMYEHILPQLIVPQETPKSPTMPQWDPFNKKPRTYEI